MYRSDNYMAGSSQNNPNNSSHTSSAMPQYPPNMLNSNKMSAPVDGMSVMPPSMFYDSSMPQNMPPQSVPQNMPPQNNMPPQSMPPQSMQQQNMPPQPGYQYSQINSSEIYDPKYSQWRDPSENKNYGGHRPYEGPVHDEYPKPGNQYQDHYQPHPAPVVQMNVVHKISAIIKSQLPILKQIMAMIPSRRMQRRKQKSRSRSRERSRKPRESMDWICPKCSFSNYEFRDKCKKCFLDRPSAKTFVPGPEDWRCIKCGNINYARRQECNRCRAPRKQS